MKDEGGRMKKERRGKQQPIFVLFLYSFANFALLCVLCVNAFNAGLWPAGVSFATRLISLLPHLCSLILHPSAFILAPSSLRLHPCAPIWHITLPKFSSKNAPSLLSCSTPEYVYPDQFSPRLRPAGRHRLLLRRQLPVGVAAVELRAELDQADCRSGSPGQSRADGADPVLGGE